MNRRPDALDVRLERAAELLVKPLIRLSRELLSIIRPGPPPRRRR